MITHNDRILLIAINPDDAAVACGGLISKYCAQTDIFCANIGGINYNKLIIPMPKSSATLYNDFKKISQKAKINKIFIHNPANSEELQDTLESRIELAAKELNIKEYDIILAPRQDETTADYQFAGGMFLKTLLEKTGYKDNLKLYRYELWNPLKNANYFEDITNVIEQKRDLIKSYKTVDNAKFTENVINMNKFRSFTSGLANAEYVEAYYADNLKAFLQVPDIINAKTDRYFHNENLDLLFEGKNIQAKIDKLGQEFYDKKIVLYKADDYTRYIFKNYNLSNLNISAIADERFEENRVHEFYGIRCISPNVLKTYNCDVILISDNDYINKLNDLINILDGTKNQTAEIRPLIKTELKSFIKDVSDNKICARPFHTASIVPSGHCITCCPAYIKNYTIGNLLQKSFKEVWNSSRAKILRASLLNNDYSLCDLNTCIQMELTERNELLKYIEDTNGNIKMPDTIYMGWDYDCNVACITCRNNIIKNSEATLSGLQSLEPGILEACKTAKLFYTSGNGDPFGSSYARNLIKKVAEINPDIKFFIHTNGILCTEQLCEELKIKDRISNVIFSVHAACKETYDKIVRYGNFDKVMQNMEWISRRKKSGQIQKFILAFVVHKINYKDMPDFVRIAEKFDALASFRYYRQWANNTEYNYNDMAVFEKHHEEYPQLAEVLKDNIFNSPNCSLDPCLREIREKRLR